MVPESFKMAQYRSKWAQDGPRWALDGPSWSKMGPCWAILGHLVDHFRAKNVNVQKTCFSHSCLTFCPAQKGAKRAMLGPSSAKLAILSPLGGTLQQHSRIIVSKKASGRQEGGILEATFPLLSRK